MKYNHSVWPLIFSGVSGVQFLEGCLKFPLAIG